MREQVVVTREQVVVDRDRKLGVRAVLARGRTREQQERSGEAGAIGGGAALSTRERTVRWRLHGATDTSTVEACIRAR